jgi:hypothetical protein
MARKQKERRRKDLNRMRAKDCCGRPQLFLGKRRSSISSNYSFLILILYVAFIENHSGLRGFAASKIATAYLLKALETQFCIAKEAVSLELSKIEVPIQE